MKSLIFISILTLSVSAQAFLGLTSKEEKRCIKEFTGRSHIAEKSAKDICKRQSSLVMVECALYISNETRSSVDGSALVCIDGMKYQAAKFQTFQSCIIGIVNQGMNIQQAKTKCIYNVNAHVATPQPAPAPVQTNPSYPTYSTNPYSQGGYQSTPNYPSSGYTPYTPNYPYPQTTTPAYPNYGTPDPSQPVVVPQVMSKVPDYQKTYPVTDPTGIYFEELPEPEMIIPDQQGMPIETPITEDQTENGLNYLDLIL